MIGMTGDDNINGRITRNKSELDESLKSARMSLKESEEKKMRVVLPEIIAILDRF